MGSVILYVKKDIQTFIGRVLNKLVLWLGKKGVLCIDSFSDGYHSFDELYGFRLVLQAYLFNLLYKQGYRVEKSWRHSDGELCFGGGWFIVVLYSDYGQISNHYEARYWDLFRVKEVDKVSEEWDGHSSIDALNRLMNMLTDEVYKEEGIKKIFECEDILVKSI